MEYLAGTLRMGEASTTIWKARVKLQVIGRRKILSRKGEDIVSSHIERYVVTFIVTLHK